MKNHKRKRNALIEQREEGFVNRWATNDRRQLYNALQDDHSAYYFVLPSVQQHLRKMKRAIRKQVSSEASRVARSIEKKIDSLQEYKQPKKRSRRKMEKKLLYAQNFYRRGAQTEVLRQGNKRGLSPHSKQTAQKNFTQSKLPPLTRNTNQADKLLAVRTQRPPAQPVQTHNLSYLSNSSPSHQRFQKFLQTKKQQVLQGSISGSALI